MKPANLTASAFFLLITVLLSQPVAAATIHVPADHPTIQAGIDAAAGGDVVLVDPGTYVENINFLGKAVEVRSETGYEETVIDGSRLDPVVRFVSSETDLSVIDGFTIRNGCDPYGCGIYCESSSPTITNCLITENHDAFAGGGISMRVSSSPTITNCVIVNNSAGFPGGGIHCETSSGVVAHCTVVDNTAGSGAGISIWYSSSLLVTNCIVRNNHSSQLESYDSELLVTYSDVQGGAAGEGNIDADPLFVGEFVGEGDYHVFLGSPCIDAGTDAGVVADMDGRARPLRAGFDMGAYEYPDCADSDGDGYGSEACGGYDCDDADAGAHPGAEEICDNEIDDDCDGFVDFEDSHCVGIHIPADYPTIQAGIDAADDGVHILVAPGTYVETIDFSGKEVILRSEQGPEVTVIDGNRAGSVVTFNNGEGRDAVLEGFTIRNGSGKGFGLPEISYYGAGIYCSGTSPSILYNHITANTIQAGCVMAPGAAKGGGIYINGGAPLVEGNVISGNSAKADPNCSSFMCCGSGHGGGIAVDGGEPVIANNTFYDNSAIGAYDIIHFIGGSGYGGAIYSNGSSLILHNTIVSNVARAGASGNYGGGAYLDSNETFTNNIVINNGYAPWYAIGGIDCSGSPTITYNDVRNNDWDDYGDGCGTPDPSNISVDPLLVGSSGDYHLTDGSPCIDSGTDAGIGIDMEGDERPQGAGFDMGSDEYADLDADGYASWEDCDDEDPSVHPGAEELCDGKDTDCDQAIPFDELDSDLDGWMICEGDCDDSDPALNPGAEEICEGGIDEDCDGLVDGDDPDCAPEFTLALDASYGAGILSLNFTIGTPEPAIWANFLISTHAGIQVIPLWSVPLSVIDPPIQLPIAFSLPGMGWIGFLTTLYTAEGSQAMGFAWVDTG